MKHHFGGLEGKPPRSSSFIILLTFPTSDVYMTWTASIQENTVLTFFCTDAQKVPVYFYLDWAESFWPTSLHDTTQSCLEPDVTSLRQSVEGLLSQDVSAHNVSSTVWVDVNLFSFNQCNILIQMRQQSHKSAMTETFKSTFSFRMTFILCILGESSVKKKMSPLSFGFSNQFLWVVFPKSIQGFRAEDVALC